MHNRKMNKKINRIHERILKIVNQDDASTFEELLKDNYVKIHTRKLHILATEIFQVKNGIVPPLLEKVFQIANPNGGIQKVRSTWSEARGVLKKRMKTNRGRGVKSICTFAL